MPRASFACFGAGRELSQLIGLHMAAVRSFSPEPGTDAKSIGPRPATVRLRLEKAVGRESSPGMRCSRDRKLSDKKYTIGQIVLVLRRPLVDSLRLE